MNKKAESIGKHREKDADFLRGIYISIIEESTDKDGKVSGTSQEIKNVIEASKNLARLQHLLQVEKITQKNPTGKNKAFDTIPPKLSPDLQAKIEELTPPNEVE